jgi:hypothetical protein
VVGHEDGGDDESMPMPKPVTVWMVQLEPRGSLDEVRGILRMDGEGVVFADAKADTETRIPFRTMTKVRRALGSPVLVLHWRGVDGTRWATAFYFAKPPPIVADRRTERAGLEELRLSGSLGRPSGGSSRRRQRRESIGYLATRSRDAKASISVWTKEIRARAGA